MKVAVLIIMATLALAGCKRNAAPYPGLSSSDTPMQLSTQSLTPQAEAGDAQAQYKLGLLYNFQGDRSQAVKWITMAAQQGVPDAQNDLGTMYFNGTGVEKNVGEACKWWKQAADNNSQPALYGAALCLGSGVNGASDPIESYAYLRVCKFLKNCYFWDKRATSTIDAKIAEYESIFKQNPQVEQQANARFTALQTRYAPLISQQFGNQ